MNTIAHPKRFLDQSIPQVAAAREAEQSLYNHYDLETKSHRIELSSGRGVRIVESGSGPALLLMPGGVGDGWIWAPLMAELPGYRLLIVNRPGGGLSDGVDHTKVDVRRLAVDALTAIIDHFQLDQVPIICNSMGGLWSFWFTLARPGRVSSLTQLGCPALILNTSAPLPMRLMSVPLLNRLLVKAMIPNSKEEAREMPTFLGHEERVGKNWPEAMAACSYHFPRLPTYKTAWLSLMEAVLSLRGAKARYNFGAEQLKQVRPAVHYVWGDNDPFGDLEMSRKAREITPNATLHEWQGGHLPWWDDASTCARLVQEFLN